VKRRPRQAATGEPCPRCLELVQKGKLPRETLQPLRGGALDALARDGSGRCCRDCQAADTLAALAPALSFPMARLAVGNDRQEQLRLPGAQLGLVGQGLMQPSEEGDLERHRAWIVKLFGE
jgi:hypothetical protein